MAPSKELPPEIWAEIFRLCLDAQSVKIPPRSPSSEMPWVVGRVCSQWRSIALSDRQLWTDVSITSSKKISQGVVHEVLSRSGNLRLTLSASSAESSQNILNLTPEYCARVDSLIVRIDLSQPADLVKLSSFTELETMCIIYHPTPNVNVYPPTHVFLSPTIQDLTLMSNVEELLSLRAVGLSLASVAWSNLAYLDVQSPIYIPPLAALEILRQCRWLMQCTITVRQEESDQSVFLPYPEPIVLSELQSLTISSMQFALGLVLDSLVLPSLIVLDMGNGMEPPWPQNEILSLIRRSRCHIKSFRSGYNQVDIADVLPLMRAMPEVVELDLGVNAAVPEEILDTVEEEKLVPQLEELFLIIDNAGAALRFLESRWMGGIGQALERGTIALHEEEREEDEAGVKRLEAAIAARGVEIALEFI